MHLSRLAALPVLALALCSASSFAQTTRLPVVQHQVQAGDTLEQLAAATWAIAPNGKPCSSTTAALTPIVCRRGSSWKFP